MIVAVVAIMASIFSFYFLKLLWSLLILQSIALNHDRKYQWRNPSTYHQWSLSSLLWEFHSHIESYWIISNHIDSYWIISIHDDHHSYCELIWWSSIIMNHHPWWLWQVAVLAVHPQRCPGSEQVSAWEQQLGSACYGRRQVVKTHGDGWVIMAENGWFIMVIIGDFWLMIVMLEWCLRVVNRFRHWNW